MGLANSRSDNVPLVPMLQVAGRGFDMTTRVARRLWLQRGRRPIRLDPAQYALEAEPRARAARRVRALLRQGVPLVVRHQRWGGVRSLLKDVSVDLLVADASVQAAVLNFESLNIREDPQGWSVLLDSAREALDLPARSARVPLHEQACLEGLVDSFASAAARGRAALLCCGAEALPVRALELLRKAYREHRLRDASAHPMGLLMAARGGQRIALGDHRQVWLPDLSVREGVGLLVEHGLDHPRELAQRVVWMLGGVPDFVERAAFYRGDLKAPEWRRVLGTPYIHLRNAIAMARANEVHAQRLDRLSDLGVYPFDPELDPHLVEAGLVRQTGGTVRLRAPLVAKVDKALTRS